TDEIETQLGFDPLDATSTPPSVIPPERLAIASVDSEELAQGDYAAEYAIDGQAETLWQTSFTGNAPQPHYLVIALDEPYMVEGLLYLPRQDGSLDGTVTSYSISVSLDGAAWEEVAVGAFAPDATCKAVLFPGKMGAFVAFVALGELNQNPWTAVAEIT